MPFVPVPLDLAWVTGRSDLKAIYRRPVLTWAGSRVVQVTDAEGRPLWDLTAGLPLRRHMHWVAKGYQYITLADAESLCAPEVVGSLQARGLNWRDFICHPATGSPWSYEAYRAWAAQAASEASSQQDAVIAQYGAEVVRAVANALTGQRTPPVAAPDSLALDVAPPAPEDPLPVRRGPGRPRKGPMP